MPSSSILEPGGLGDPSILTVSSDPPFPAPKHILQMLYSNHFTVPVHSAQYMYVQGRNDDCFFLGGFADVYIHPRKMVRTYYVRGGQ